MPCAGGSQACPSWGVTCCRVTGLAAVVGRMGAQAAKSCQSIVVSTGDSERQCLGARAEMGIAKGAVVKWEARPGGNLERFVWGMQGWGAWWGAPGEDTAGGMERGTWLGGHSGGHGGGVTAGGCRAGEHSEGYWGAHTAGGTERGTWPGGQGGGNGGGVTARG